MIFDVIIKFNNIINQQSSRVNSDTYVKNGLERFITKIFYQQLTRYIENVTDIYNNYKKIYNSRINKNIKK